VLSGPSALEYRLSAAQRRTLRAGRSPWATGPPAGAIVTLAALAVADLAPVDVLVRADAGTGLPPLTPGQLAQPDGDDRSLLLVDVSDRHHPLLRRARRREAAYRARGWFGSGVAPARGRVERFLASRPEGGGP